MTDLVVVLAVQNAQDGEEQVENVQVQADARGNVFIHVIVSHDQLSVHEDVAAEDEGCDTAVNEFGRGVSWEKGGHEAEDDHQPQGAKQVWDPAREVVLGLACEHGQEDEDAQGHDEGLDDDAALVERRDDADAVRFQGGEAAQEDHVLRITLALPVRQKHEADGAKQRHPHHPRVGLDPVSVAGGEEGDAREGHGHEDLDGQDAVDLADKGHADVECRFVDGTTKLKENMSVWPKKKRDGWIAVDCLP